MSRETNKERQRRLQDRVLAFIDTVRLSFVGADQVYNDGSCMQFSLILQQVFKTAVPLLTKDRKHCVTEIYGKLWDIRGEYKGEVIPFEEGEWNDLLDDGFDIYHRYFMEIETRGEYPMAEGLAEERSAVFEAHC